MLTLYHSPRTRSSRIVQLVHELGALDRVEIRPVGIMRQDGSGGRDAANPHPEGKVPILVHDGVEIWESNAIMLYLTEIFPEAGLGIAPGDPQRGRFLSWLAWYGDVMEPVLVHRFAGLSHPALTATFRGFDEMAARLTAALSDDDWLVGGRHTAADLLLVSAFTFAPEMMPSTPALDAWVARCQARPSVAFIQAYDADLLG